MRPEEDASLTGGGDCFSHWHSSDRQPTHDLLEGLQDLATVNTASASYIAKLKDDYHLITASSALGVTLPKARNNRLITFVKVGGAFNITLAPAAGETINGSASLVITTAYTPVRLLARSGIGYVQV